MANSLKKHKTADLIKWIITLVIGLALIGAVIGLSVKLERQTSFTTIGGESYSIGVLDENGEYEKSDKGIYLHNSITTDGLKCTLAKDSKITYKLFFYDKDGKFISATEQLSTNWNGSAPDKAVSVKIVITPTADEDNKVSLVEVLGYANQLTVVVNK